MNLQHHPELLNRIAASYALGTLRGQARRRFEAMAREQPTVRAAALIWQSHFASVTELQASQAPAPAVWTRIDNLVHAERARATMQVARVAPVSQRGGWAEWLSSLTVWRVASAAGALATVVAVTVGIGQRDRLGDEIASLQTQLQAAPQVQYVAVLSNEAATASMLVTFDAKNKSLNLQRVGAYREADDRSLQLWALPRSGAPRSLGVLGQDALMRLNASAGDLQEIPALAISLEPKGGVPSATGPTGPVLFKGALIQKML